MAIKFNQVLHVGNEQRYLDEVLHANWTSGNGPFSQRVQQHMYDRYGFHFFPTHSCTAALEMAALLLDLGPDDEVILPSFTFVSTASAVALRGAKLIFADSDENVPNIGINEIQRLHTPATKAVFVVHYAGMALELDAIRAWCNDRGIYLVEDAAQSIHNTYTSLTESSERWIGSVGDLATFSFHETKNISCGQGGGLVVNRPEFANRAQQIWEKGTNRKQFVEGIVDKYGWVELGSSFLSSEFTNAVLLAQLEEADRIHAVRIGIWNRYHEGLLDLEEAGHLTRMVPVAGSGNNGHLYYLTVRDLDERNRLISWMNEGGVQTTFHYQPLELSPFMSRYANTRPTECPNSKRFAETLIRLPLHLHLSNSDVEQVIGRLVAFFAR